jgi:hypothetical protein
VEAMFTQVDHLRIDETNKVDLFAMEAIAPEADMDHYHTYPLYHKAIKAEDKEEFVKAMYDEVQGQINNNVYSPVLQSSVPPNIKVLPASRERGMITIKHIHRGHKAVNPIKAHLGTHASLAHTTN